MEEVRHRRRRLLRRRRLAEWERRLWRVRCGVMLRVLWLLLPLGAALLRELLDEARVHHGDVALVVHVPAREREGTARAEQRGGQWANGREGGAWQARSCHRWMRWADMPCRLLPPCVMALRNVVICWRCCSRGGGGRPPADGIGRWPGPALGCDMEVATVAMAPSKAASVALEVCAAAEGEEE